MDEKEFLLSLRDYIERSEVAADGEWGSSRSLARIIEDGDMPDVYAEVLTRIAAYDKEEGES